MNETEANICELKGVTKRFLRREGWRGWLPGSEAVEVVALDRVDLAVRKGEVVGLVGKNGSGKSTLLRLIAGLLECEAGTTRVLGVDPVKEPIVVGVDVSYVLSNDRSFFWRLSLQRNLEFFGILNDMPGDLLKRRVQECIDLLGLRQAARQPFRELSDGMKQRAAIARGLLAEPRLLLVDEATRSLDHGHAQNVRRILRKLADERSVGILWASHNLEEVEAVCDRVILLEAGHVALEGAPLEIGAEIRRRLELEAAS